MSSGRGLVKGFHEIDVGWFRDIESVFKVQSPISELPISLGSSGNPGFAILIIHGGKGFSYDWVCHRGRRDFVGKGIDGAHMEILIFSFQEGDLLVTIASLTSSFLERTSVGPMLIPHSTPQRMSYSCRNNHH